MSEPASAEPIYLETRDVSRLLGVASNTVRVLARTGELPVRARTLRGSRLFVADDILAWRARRAQEKAVAR